MQTLDQRLGPDASKIKRSEHIFAQPDDLGVLMTVAGFDSVNVSTITQRITFPSVFDYVRFQLIATPMAGLLSNRTDSEREETIRDIATSTQLLINADMLRYGRLSFPQEAFVATANRVT